MKKRVWNAASRFILSEVKWNSTPASVGWLEMNEIGITITTSK